MEGLPLCVLNTLTQSLSSLVPISSFFSFFLNWATSITILDSCLAQTQQPRRSPNLGLPFIISKPPILHWLLSLLSMRPKLPCSYIRPCRALRLSSHSSCGCCWFSRRTCCGKFQIQYGGSWPAGTAFKTRLLLPRT